MEASTKGAVLLFVSSEVESRAKSFGLSDVLGGIAAGMAGGVAQAYTVMGFCTRMKTVEITKPSVEGAIPTSTWTEFRKIWRLEGIRGLNRGANAVALRQMSNWGSRFGFARLSEGLVRRTVGKREDQNLNSAEKIFCAAVGGAFACWNQPIEVVRVEMQSKTKDLNRPKGLTVTKTLMYIYKSSGMKGLYRGVLPRMSLGIWQTICLVAFGDMYDPQTLDTDIPSLMGSDRAKDAIAKRSGQNALALS